MNIKRPVILFLGATILGIIIAYSGVPTFFKLLLVAIAIFLYLKTFIEGKLIVRTLVIILLFFLIGFYRFRIEEKIFDTYNERIEPLAKGNKVLTGIVDIIGKSTNSNYYILKNCEIDGIKLGTCRCYFADEINPNAKIGNCLKVIAGTQIIDGPSNEGEFNQRNYYRSSGISFISFAKSFEITNNNIDKLRQGIYDIKTLIKTQIQKIFNYKDAGLFSAMVTGDKSTIDKEQKRLFSDNGIAHILAISGLHLSILGLAIFELLRKKFSINISAGVVSIFILLYGIFIDAGATSLRAISMLYIRFLSLSIGRTYDSKNTLYIICFIFLMLHPYLLFNAGFQFSYVAIFALNEEVYINVRRYKKYEKIKVPAVITLTLFLFPITIYHYFTYPLYSILLNLIVIPLMTFVLGFGLIGLLVSFFVLPLGKMLVFVVHIIFIIYEKLCYFIEGLPLHLLWIGQPSLYEVLYFYVALFLIIYALKNRNLNIDNNVINAEDNNIEKNKSILDLEKYKIKFPIARIVICLILLVLSVGILGIRPRSDLRMTFMSIGQGDSILIESGNKILTIDGGSSSNTSAGQYVFTPHIKSRALNHIDYAFITHPDSDHTNAMLYLMENEDEVKLKNLVLPINAMTNNKFSKLKSAATSCGANVMYLKECDILNIKDNFSIKVLNPDEESVNNNLTKKGKEKYDVNELSLSFRLDYKEHSALFTGDIGKQMMARMVKDEYVKNNMDVEVLKVPHHGSKNSFHAGFYTATRPKYAVISYGRNSYGHPSDLVVDGFERIGAIVLKTMPSGQIDMYFDKQDISYKMYKKKQ